MSRDEPEPRDGRPELRLHVRHPRPDVAVVAVAGSLDIATDTELRRRLGELTSKHLILDVAGMDFLAASGVRALLDLNTTRTRAGATLHLTGATGNAQVGPVLDLLDVHRALDVRATVADALAALPVTSPRQYRRGR